MLNSVQGHQKGLLVADLQFSPDRTYFITELQNRLSISCLYFQLVCHHILILILQISQSSVILHIHSLQFPKLPSYIEHFP